MFLCSKSMFSVLFHLPVSSSGTAGGAQAETQQGVLLPGCGDPSDRDTGTRRPSSGTPNCCSSGQGGFLWVRHSLATSWQWSYLGDAGEASPLTKILRKVWSTEQRWMREGRWGVHEATVSKKCAVTTWNINSPTPWCSPWPQYLTEALGARDILSQIKACVAWHQRMPFRTFRTVLMLIWFQFSHRLVSVLAILISLYSHISSFSSAKPQRATFRMSS